MGEFEFKPYSEEDARVEAEFLSELSFANTSWIDAPNTNSPADKAKFLDKKLAEAKELVSAAKNTPEKRDRAKIYREVQIILKSFEALGLHLWETRHSWEAADWSIFPEQKKDQPERLVLPSPEGFTKIEHASGIIKGIESEGALKPKNAWIGVGLFESSYPNRAVASVSQWGARLFGNFRTIIIDEPSIINQWALLVTSRYRQLEKPDVILALLNQVKEMYYLALLQGSTKAGEINTILERTGTSHYLSSVSQELSDDRRFFNDFYLSLYKLLVSNPKSSIIMRGISKPFVKNKTELKDQIEASIAEVKRAMKVFPQEEKDIINIAEDIVWNLIGAYTAYEIALIFYYAYKKGFDIKVGASWEKPYDEFAVLLTTQEEFKDFQRLLTDTFKIPKEKLDQLGFIYFPSQEFKDLR